MEDEDGVVVPAIWIGIFFPNRKIKGAGWEAGHLDTLLNGGEGPGMGEV